MTITLAASPIWLIVCLLGAVAIAAYTYQETPAHVTAWVRYGLASLRGLAVFLMLILLLQPVALQSETREEQPVVAVLLDTSRSIPYIAEEGPLLTELAGAFDALGQLQDVAELQFFTFAENLRSRGLPPGHLESVTFDGHRTNIGGALIHVEQQFQDQALNGIVMLTDGHANTLPDPRQSARQLNTPAHTVAIGDTSRPDAAQITRIQTNERAFVDRETPVRIHVNAQGLANEVAEVRLYRDEAQLDAATFSLPVRGITEQVDLSFTPTESGIHTYRVELEALSDELSGDPETKVFALRSLTERRQAMLVAGGPSPSVSALRQTIQREADLDLITHIEQADGSFYEGAMTTPPDSVDLLILAGYPTTRSPSEPLESISQILSADTPALFQLGSSVDPVALSDLSQYLPIRVDGSFGNWQSTTVRPAPLAGQHAAFSHASPTGGWELLPEVLVPRDGWNARADARSLLESDGDLPVVATREFSAHRSSAVMASNAWQWHNLPPSLDQQRDLWRTFLRDLALWSLADPADERVTVSPAQPDFHENERVTFDVQVDNQQDGLAGASVTLTVYGPQGEAESFVLERASAGMFNGEIAQLPAGAYTFEATAEVNGSVVGEDRGSFSVGAHDPEESFSFADGELLYDIAVETGGSFTLLGEVHELAGVIRNQLDETRLERELVRERLFWQWPILLGVILALFSTEWFIRKRKGLP